MIYRSKFEKNIADYLDSIGIDYSYEELGLEYFKHVTMGFCPECECTKVKKQGWYTPDFVIGNIIIEAKGKFTPRDRTKMIAVKACHPNLDIRILLMRDNWVTKKKLQRYSDWCDKNGFPYHVSAIGEVPEEWILESRSK